MLDEFGEVLHILHFADGAPGESRITAATTLVAFTGDLFFPPEDVKADADRIPGAKFRETGTVWGHFTMFNLREQDTAAIYAIYADVLAS